MERSARAGVLELRTQTEGSSTNRALVYTRAAGCAAGRTLSGRCNRYGWNLHAQRYFFAGLYPARYGCVRSTGRVAWVGSRPRPGVCDCAVSLRASGMRVEPGRGILSMCARLRRRAAAASRGEGRLPGRSGARVSRRYTRPLTRLAVTSDLCRYSG